MARTGRTKAEQRTIPLRITDTTLRDAHQSLWATRMRTDDILKIIEVVDSIGFYSLEVWGGATFDVCLRFLRENPWERLRKIKAIAKKTPLQMLLRGQNIVGYRNYPDDLLEHFIALACENGVDIFRIFDALNDNRNMERSIAFVKKYGGHAQGTLSYTISPVHTVEQYVRVAKEQVQMGIDSLCIKDMAGILSPIAAEKLVSALVRQINVPIQLHCHTTSGVAIASYVEGVRAGAGAIDCAISPMAGFQSQPPVETMLAIFEEMPYHATLDVDGLRRMCRYFLNLKRQLGFSQEQPENIIDPEILIHHIPGGMISNLRSQLEKQNALDKIDEVFKELPLVRKELGYPPLVTPTSQIIGIQAVMNVLAGERYKMVPQEVKDYVKGLYGKSPAKIDPEIRKLILGKEKPITGRPADLLEPMLPNVTQHIDPKLIHGEEDIISYALFPEPALEFFKWRDLPLEERPSTPADLELKQRASGMAGAPQLPARAADPLLPPEDYKALHELLDKARQLNITELSIARKDFELSLKSEGVTCVRTPQPAEMPKPAQQPPAPPQKAAKPGKGKKGRADKKTAAEPAKAEGAAPAAAAAAPAVATASPAAAASPVAATSDVAVTVVPAAVPAAAATAAAAAQPVSPAPAPQGPTINAPLGGTFYSSPAAGKPQFVNVGDVVEAGATVCTVEAMKLFNEVKAPEKCKIVEILVAHATAVQKDQPIMRFERVG